MVVHDRWELRYVSALPRSSWLLHDHKKIWIGSWIHCSDMHQCTHKFAGKHPDHSRIQKTQHKTHPRRRNCNRAFSHHNVHFRHRVRRILDGILARLQFLHQHRVGDGLARCRSFVSAWSKTTDCCQRAKLSDHVIAIKTRYSDDLGEIPARLSMPLKGDHVIK